MERCNLQAMLKLVKLCERHSTNRLRGFDFNCSPNSVAPFCDQHQAHVQRLHNIPAGQAQPYMALS